MMDYRDVTVKRRFERERKSGAYHSDDTEHEVQDGRKCRDAFLAVGVYDGGCFVIGLVHVETDGKCRLELSMVSTSFGCFSWYIVEWAEAEENGEDLCRPYHRICVDCIRTKCFSALLCGRLWVGYSHSLHNSVAYGYGYGVDRTDCRHEGGYSGRCIGSIVVCWAVSFIPGISQMLFFALAFGFYDSDTGAYDEPGGLSKQERNCLCLRN